MVKIDSSDYHDYVIKDGRLVGEFDQMYKNATDVPWHQDSQKDWLDVKIACDLLKGYAPFDYICDFGCGLGYYVDIIRRNVKSDNCKTTGYDVSPTCCKKAKVLFPDIEFKTIDLTMTPTCNDGVGRGNQLQASRRLFLIRGTLWYVSKNMPNVVANIASLTHLDDKLLIVQNFPPLRSTFVGKDSIPDSEAIVSWFDKYFEPLETIWINNYVIQGNNNWFIGIFRRK